MRGNKYWIFINSSNGREVGVSRRRTQILCSQERIPRATKIGLYWEIPDDAVNSKDAKIKSGKYIKSKNTDKQKRLLEGK